jgi:hypothetical protein
VRTQVKELVTAQPVMTPLWAAPEVRLPFPPAFPACLLALRPSPHRLHLATAQACAGTGASLAPRLGGQGREATQRPSALGARRSPPSCTANRRRRRRRPPAQVVRHERASIKADIWSYGILIWELVSGEDITEYQPLAISRQVIFFPADS